MIEFAVPLLVIAVGCYLGARLAWLAGWQSISGVSRLLALWAVAAWIGYGTPLFVGLLALPLGLVWSRLSVNLPLLILFELGLAVALVWYSGAPPELFYVIGLVLADQFLTRFSLLRFDRQREINTTFHRLLIVLGIVCIGVFGNRYYKEPILSYANTHHPQTTLNLVPQGAAVFWFQKRVLSVTSAAGAVPSSVYWESRFSKDSGHCVLAFHGAAVAGSLQGASRAFAKGARTSGLRYFAIDHPGFGASPTPAGTAPADAWDPALLSAAVLERMRIASCTEIRVLGHSQGVTETLRILTSNNALVAEALVFGAGLYSADPERETYWHQRFHSDRGLTQTAQKMDFDTWKLVRDLYYLNQEYCGDTEAGRNYRDIKPLNFVVFAQEHPNLVATRDKLQDCMGYPEMRRTTLATDHYLDSAQLGSLVLVPHSSPALVADLLPAPPAALPSPETEANESVEARDS